MIEKTFYKGMKFFPKLETILNLNTTVLNKNQGLTNLIERNLSFLLII